MSAPHIALHCTEAQVLVDYLKTRPYVEVSKLIESLLRAPRVEVVQPEAKKEEQP
jgi:hypothetical protein